MSKLFFYCSWTSRANETKAVGLEKSTCTQDRVTSESGVCISAFVFAQVLAVYSCGEVGSGFLVAVMSVASDAQLPKIDDDITDPDFPLHQQGPRLSLVNSQTVLCQSQNCTERDSVFEVYNIFLETVMPHACLSRCLVSQVTHLRLMARDG
jgi:hypothetical protein